MNTPQYLCEGALVGNLDKPNDQIVWYKACGTTPLAANEPLEAGMYYAAQKAGDCESDCTPVEVILDRYPPPTTLSNQCYKPGLTLGDLIVIGTGTKWYADEFGGPSLSLLKLIYTGEEYWVAQSSGSCESDRVKVTIVGECYDPYGTVFPFVHTGFKAFDDLFETTAKLYIMPPANVIDKYGFVRKQTPVHATIVTFYNCAVDDVIVGAPKDPGYMGNLNNPGRPIRWRTGAPSPAILTPSDKCPTVNIGKYRFTGVAPGNYILEITRKGFLVRYGIITVEGNNYLGHREIIGGDLNGDLMITTTDYSTIRQRLASYGSNAYNAMYDLRGNAYILSGDLNIVYLNLGVHANIYEETYNWLNFNTP